MNDSEIVHRGQTVSNTFKQRHDIGRFEAAVLQYFFQRFARDEFHYQTSGAAFVAQKSLIPDDRIAVYPAKFPRFPDEQLEDFLVIREFRQDYLYRMLRVMIDMPGPVDLAHASPSEKLLDYVGSVDQGRPNAERLLALGRLYYGRLAVAFRKSRTHARGPTRLNRDWLEPDRLRSQRSEP